MAGMKGVTSKGFVKGSKPGKKGFVDTPMNAGGKMKK